MAITHVHVITKLATDFDLRLATMWYRDPLVANQTWVRFISSDTWQAFPTTTWEAAKTASLNQEAGTGGGGQAPTANFSVPANSQLIPVISFV